MGSKKATSSGVDWKRVRELYLELVARPTGERERALAGIKDLSPATRRELHRMLLHTDRVPPDFMPAPDTAADAQRAEPDRPDPLIGARIGRYEIRSRIAAGGMGTVYEAHEARLNRPVALKVMRLGLSAGASRRRFEHESKVLARLQHPHIARVYEAGTYRMDAIGEAPYFVMEFIPQARTIQVFVRETGLGIRDRLRLFAQVCDAVHHGHQKGIIHRDLKPGNILVDAFGHPKIIDFGVARSTDADVAATTMQTDLGQLVGTVHYMSPEQFAADPLELDTRSDVYSLGVVLFELLTEKLPYDLSDKSLPSMARVVCECEPIRPSSIDPKLKGDLDSIVLKALEKDRDRRYRSASDLALDIKRHLAGEPTEARPPGRWVRFSRWVGRHPMRVSLLASLGIALLVLSAAFVAASIANTRPLDVVRHEDGSTARLLALNRRVLHVWPSVSGGICFADRLRAGDGRDLAVIGYTRNDPGPGSGSLGAFDLRGSLDDPVWQHRITTEDLPQKLITGRGFSGSDYGLDRVSVIDVFPEIPGDELVAWFVHVSYTQNVLRIYDLGGTLRYQVWLDAQIGWWYWMSDARLLVVSGSNGHVYWPDRGYTGLRNAHPFVVFALRPEIDFISREYVGESPGEDPLSPRWIRCLWPPEATDWVQTVLVARPFGTTDPGRSVAVKVFFKDDVAVGPGREWIIDAQGRPVPGAEGANDAYKLHLDDHPEWADVGLHDLPPILPENQALTRPAPD